jgi:hypothetical protein
MKHLVWAMTAALAVGTAAAQNPGDAMPVRIWPQIVKYLELTPQQTLALVRIQGEWALYVAGKARRVAQVESELRDVTLAEVVDPLGLGLRYMELEAICRESRQTDARLREQARKLLTADQAAKLAVLEQAYKLLPVIADADAAKLMDAPLPGLELAGVGSMWARGYPGCRYGPPVRPAPMLNAEGAQDGAEN